MDVVELTKLLVSIPSYEGVPGREIKLAEEISRFLENLGYLHVDKQMVTDQERSEKQRGDQERFNIIAHDGFPPRLMFCCHMDTVQLGLKKNWRHDPRGEVVGQKLYGLGASDMKGGIACLLQALTKFHKTHGLYLLFDVGEEYDFKGMQTFLSNFNSVPPELVIFPEPGLYITNGHRGVIEVKFRVRGETGHAKQPDKEGGNAIIGATDAVKHLKTELQHFRDDKLGESTCNLSYMYGGLDSSKNSKGKLRIKIQANKIPDIAEVLLDIRPAKKELNAKKVFEILRKYLEEKNFKLEETESNLNRGPILIPLNKLHSIEDVIKEVLGEVTYGNLGTFGYSEGGLLYEKLKSPWVCFGPGPGDTLHEANEYVNVGDLDKVSDIYRRIIEVYCGDETTAG